MAFVNWFICLDNTHLPHTLVALTYQPLTWQLLNGPDYMPCAVVSSPDRSSNLPSHGTSSNVHVGFLKSYDSRNYSRPFFSAAGLCSNCFVENLLFMCCTLSIMAIISLVSDWNVHSFSVLIKAGNQPNVLLLLLHHRAGNLECGHASYHFTTEKKYQ